MKTAIKIKKVTKKVTKKDVIKAAEKIRKITAKRLKKLAANGCFDKEEALEKTIKEIKPELEKILKAIAAEKFWKDIKKAAKEVKKFPKWMRAHSGVYGT